MEYLQQFEEINKLKSEDFVNPLDQYYPKWFEDCLDSAEYCISKGNLINAQAYIKKAQRYLEELKRIYEKEAN
jgi:hypothetical protein